MKEVKPMVENREYFEMLKRMIRAGARRAAVADEVDLKTFYEIKDFLDECIVFAVQEQKKDGASWSDIGDALGMTKQNAFRKFKEGK